MAAGPAVVVGQEVEVEEILAALAVVAAAAAAQVAAGKIHKSLHKQLLPGNLESFLIRQ